ncbi:hypothetical protein E3E31_12315 [Thermococcus sp. M39]|uniref:hypothetical protein n=1 Tax=unclassified Thermococcus TaxID=2627626 RepID=UPI001439AA87|nr:MULTISPECIES: hypothetical protein [unclassified Thermococcus]NJE09292.1 hypothetical protein [Thermococcus sp. M39]NJE13870.1 hypothetical protein [Thermococcus sp. LS2]
MVVVMKLLGYKWMDNFALVDARLECDCGHVFMKLVLEPGDVVECPKCGRKFKVLIEYKFEPLNE